MNGLLDLFADGGQGLGLGAFLVSLVLAAASAEILGRAYVAWGHTLGNRARLATTFAPIALTTAFIIAVVSSSLALSLGLVGALSITRFRAAIKEPEELTYLFLAIGLGVGYGAGQYVFSLIAFAVALVVIWVKARETADRHFNLHIVYSSGAPGATGVNEIVTVLEGATQRLDLVRLDEGPERTEVLFAAEFVDFEALSACRKRLRELVPDVDLSFLEAEGAV